MSPKPVLTPAPPKRGNSSAERPSGEPGVRAGSNRAATLLEKNPELSSRLQALLPEGQKVSDAASGFDNLGQFVSAIHVAHNLGIPFDGLKQEMLAGSSLGQALRKLKPDLSKQELQREMRRAQEQAQADLKPKGVTQRDRDRDQQRSQQQQP
ncbi:MAG: hypothetical protein ACUVXB_02395 [Bryobacteraceae bacterium]